MKETVPYLSRNFYFIKGTGLFNQKIGIPMKSDPLPFCRKVSFHYHESRWTGICLKNMAIYFGSYISIVIKQ